MCRRQRSPTCTAGNPTRGERSLMTSSTGSTAVLCRQTYFTCPCPRRHGDRQVSVLGVVVVVVILVVVVIVTVFVVVASAPPPSSLPSPSSSSSPSSFSFSFAPFSVPQEAPGGESEGPRNLKSGQKRVYTWGCRSKQKSGFSSLFKNIDYT